MPPQIEESVNEAQSLADPPSTKPSNPQRQLPQIAIDESHTRPLHRERPSFGASSADGQELVLEEQSEAAVLNKTFQNTWEEVMDISPRQTAVLMVSWDKDLDDMDTAVEVDRLGSVFEVTFGFKVVKKQLTAEKLPGHQLKMHLTQFIYEYDSESTLLIIYYAGHGTPGRPGELHFTGKNMPLDKRSARNSVPWHETENLLQDVLGDVLLILDCCYAGNIAEDLQMNRQRGYWPTRRFECLAACKRNTETHLPGERSFTTALIWALETILETRQKFTTHQLKEMIERAPGFPPKQSVQNLDRGIPSDQRLVLSPLHTSSEEYQGKTFGNPYQNFVDLRFWYPEPLDNQGVSDFATFAKKLIIEEKILAKRIDWLGYGHRDFERLRNAIEMWRRKSAAKSVDLALKVSRLSGKVPHTPPPSNSETSSISCKHCGHDDENRTSEEFVTEEHEEVSQARADTSRIVIGTPTPHFTEALAKATFSQPIVLPSALLTTTVLSLCVCAFVLKQR